MEREQDETIRELFQQLKRCDERNVPSFASSLKPVRDERFDVRAHSVRWWPLAAVVGVVLLAGIGLYYELPRTSQQTSTETARKIENTATLPSLTTIPSTVEAVVSAVRPRRARVKARPVPHAVIATWRSPTEFLLPPQDDRFLKASPRLGESLIKIRPLLAGSAN